MKLEILKGQWVPYFQKLEICEVRTPEEIITKCHDRQISMPLVQCSFGLEDLPSLIEVEDVLRQSQPDRATGLDPLPSGLFRCHAVDLATIYFPVVLKMCLWQCEPITSKGVIIAVIFKKGSGLEAARYRGLCFYRHLQNESTPCSEGD